MDKSIFKPEQVDFIFKNFTIYEEEIFNFIKIVPYSEENKNTWSTRLTNIFLDICSLFDSICRFIVSKGEDNPDKKITIKNSKGRNITRKVKLLNIEDFENNLLGNLEILNSNVVFYTYPLNIIKPFKSYRKTNGWWSIYNSLKHNRLINYTKATLENTILALAGLFLLLVRYKNDEEFSKAILVYKWVDTYIVPESFHRERLVNRGSIWYDSAYLFGTTDIPENLPDDLNKIKSAASISASRKFTDFFGHYNWKYE